MVKFSNCIAIVLFFCLAVFSSTLFADVVVYKNGERVEGKVTELLTSYVAVETQLGMVYIPLYQVKFLIFKQIATPEVGKVSIYGRRFDAYVAQVEQGYVVLNTMFGKVRIKSLDSVDYLSFEPVSFLEGKKSAGFSVEISIADQYSVITSLGDVFTGTVLKYTDTTLILIDKMQNEYHFNYDFVENIYLPYNKATSYDLFILKTGRKLYGKMRDVVSGKVEISGDWGKVLVDRNEILFTTLKTSEKTETEKEISLNSLFYDKDNTATLVVKHPIKVDNKEIKLIKVYPSEVVDPRTGVTFVFVPGGIFKMGADPSWEKVDQDELPTRNVYVSGFYISKYPITVKQYLDFLRAGQNQNVALGKGITPVEQTYLGTKIRVSFSADNGSLSFPITGINWVSAKAYCEWAGYQLPTEAQWEKAARGVDGRMYPWGNSKPTKYNDGKLDYDVKAFEATDISPYGVVNMFGLPIEYCQDYYDPNAYKKLPAENPVNLSGNLVVGRTGAILNRITDRISVNPSEIRNDFTFRVVVDADSIFKVISSPLNNKLFGVTWFSVNERVKKEYNVKSDGLYVAFVEVGSPAQLSSIKQGDIVVAVEKKAVKTQEDVVKAISGKKIGDEISVTIDREGKIFDVKLKLGVWKF
ncbi:MAG: SUMF1/EgtB/PvdO family nonheme iron enzyme [Fervidobacterium sp.]|nr:SUMF1/EgtB/PvdO family nonheme iron enzyme [Fervidobacterium sp.]